ncbi:MAG: cysteine hydrolase family protein, partial [Desulfobacterales bacterium]
IAEGVDMRQGLVLVDIQNDYFPGGKMELAGMEQAAGNARRLLQEFRNRRLPVFHIRHISKRPGATFFLPDTPGAEIHETMAPKPVETVIEKHFPNSFRNTSLLEQLKQAGVEEVVVCGAMSHMCIDATVRAAFDFGFNCMVVEDACATRDLLHKGKTVKADQVHSAFMAALSAPYAKVIAADEFCVAGAR